MIEHTAASTAAPAPPAALYPARYQDTLRRVAAATLCVMPPRAAALLRAWPDGSRVQRSWPPGVSP